jgi:hypothetical protein
MDLLSSPSIKGMEREAPPLLDLADSTTLDLWVHRFDLKQNPAHETQKDDFIQTCQLVRTFVSIIYRHGMKFP